MAEAAPELARALYRIGAVRFGEFVLKDGRTSPFYIDLRVIIGHPELLQCIATAMLDCSAALAFDCIAGIPYAGLPLAVAMSLHSRRPLVYARKEAKAYGTRKLVEGVFEPGQRALVVDDVITTGGAKLEAIAPLRDAGLIVEDIVVVVDREQSGGRALQDIGVRLYSVLKVRRLLEDLSRAGDLSAAQLQSAFDFIRSG